MDETHGAAGWSQARQAAVTPSETVFCEVEFERCDMAHGRAIMAQALSNFCKHTARFARLPSCQPAEQGVGSQLLLAALFQTAANLGHNPLSSQALHAVDRSTLPSCLISLRGFAPIGHLIAPLGADTGTRRPKLSNSFSCSGAVCAGFSSNNIQPAQGLQSGTGSAGGSWRTGHGKLLLLVPSAFAALLGCWQVNRRKWKLDLMQQREAALKAEPADVFELSPSAPEYTRVSATGIFQHHHSIFVGPRPRTVMGTATAGYTLITPLEDAEWGKKVLVNRGWVPAEWLTNPEMRAAGEPQGLVCVKGVTRSGEKPSGFVPANDPAKGQWYFIDPPAIARACNLSADVPLMEALADGKGTPARAAIPTSMDVLAMRARVPRDENTYPLSRASGDLMSFSVMPVDHRNYAATWFTLSAATAVLAVRAVRQTRM